MTDVAQVRLLVVNANTSEEVTRIVAEAASAAAQPGTSVRAVTAAGGPAIIQTEEDHQRAEAACVETVQRHAGLYDAVLVAVSLDTAVETLARMCKVPVLGMTQPALDAAAASGQRLGVLTIGDQMKQMFMSRFRLPPGALVHSVNLTPVQVMQARREGTQLSSLLAAGVEELARQGAEVALPVGATVAGLAGSVQALSRIRVLESIACAVWELEHRLGKPLDRSVG